LLKQGDRSFTADQVRLVWPDGERQEVVSLARARELAVESGLDLVLVSDRAVPPVVRVMNFGKLQYEQKKTMKEQRKHATTQKIKEIKFHVNVDTNDYQIKIKKSLEFLEKGYRLKLTLALRGREMAHQDLAYELMNRVLVDLGPYGEADGKPELLGRNITVNFAPK